MLQELMSLFKDELTYLALGSLVGIIIISIAVVPILLIMYFVDDIDGSGFGFFGYAIIKSINKIIVDVMVIAVILSLAMAILENYLIMVIILHLLLITNIIKDSIETNEKKDNN